MTTGLTATLMAQLKRHYINPTDPMPGGLFIPECGINGATGGSRADALFVGFTSASGRILIGHEVKVSRSDWRRELDKVGKADTWADSCHAWNIVAPPGIVQLDELPHGWGLLEPTPKLRTRLKVVVKARVHQDRTPSWDTVRSMMARSDTLRAAAMREFRDDTERETRKALEEQFARRAEQTGQSRLTLEQSAKLDAVAKLEEVLGVDLTVWAYEDHHIDPSRLAAAIAVVRDAGTLPHVEHLARQANDLATAAKRVATTVAEWRAVSARG